MSLWKNPRTKVKNDDDDHYTYNKTENKCYECVRSVNDKTKIICEDRQESLQVFTFPKGIFLHHHLSDILSQFLLQDLSFVTI